MDIDVGCRFTFELPARTHAVLMVEPHTTEVDHVISSRMDLSPGIAATSMVDGFGNRCRRLTIERGVITIGYAATVEVADATDPVCADAVVPPVELLPDEVLPYLLPSRYCESDRIADIAWAEFGSIPRGWQQVQAVSDWVHEQIRFDYGSSSPFHSATVILDGRVGVCRDFTHLAIAFCRALNIPARYVFGYLPDIGVPDPGSPMDFCAWMEVYIGDRWHTFDPRNNQRRIGRVVIGRGRDAADVAMVTSFGKATLIEMTVVAEKSNVHTGVTAR